MASGNVVALIHGYGFDSRLWDPVDIAFDGFQVIRLKLPGFGLGQVKESYTIESLAKEYWHMLDEQQIDSVHLVGHSMGGYVCTEMLAQMPSHVASLALIHSHVYADSEEKKKARTTTMDEIKNAGREAFVRKMIGSMAYDKVAAKSVLDILTERGLSYNDDAWYYGTQAIRDRSDHNKTFSQYTNPVLIIQGEEDVAVPVELAYKQAAIASQAKLVVYKGVGHLSMYENTLGLISDLVSFYREQKK